MQSRYYTPNRGRFLNADALVSTGQGLLGNNMFAYCGNNPVKYLDSSGALREPCTISMNTPGIGYLYDQEAEPFASKPLGEGTIGLNGCGAFASYNALISLDDARLFAEVYDYYTADPSRILANGEMGIPPWAVAQFFNSLGYTVRIGHIRADIERMSEKADACIMMYLYSGTNSLGGHYIEYSKTSSGYIGRNTGTLSGTRPFTSPWEYGLSGSNFYVLGICIYKEG